MIPKFFIDRPIFATVLSVFITLAGVVALASLPFAQYPQVAPPTIQIDCNYPGASALVVSQSIAAPIEQQVNGVEDMLYMTSQCTSDGSYTCTITFKSGTDLNMAQVRVQNRVNLAMPQLPDVVRATGITTPQALAGNSPHGRNHVPAGTRIPQGPLRPAPSEQLRRAASARGTPAPAGHQRRDHLRAARLRLARLDRPGPTGGPESHGSADVVNAIRQQNLAAGRRAGRPAADRQRPAVSVHPHWRRPARRAGGVREYRCQGRARSGRLVRVKDVAAWNWGRGLQDASNRFDDKPTVGMGVFILPESEFPRDGRRASRPRWHG